MGIVQSWADILSVRTIPVACSSSHRNCRVVVGQLWGFVDIRRRVLLGASSVRAAVMMWVEQEQGNYQVWKSSVLPVRSHLVGCKLRGWRDCGLGAWRVGRGCLFVVVPWSFSRGTPHDRGRRPELNRQSSGPCVTALPHQRVSHKQDRVKRRLPLCIPHGLSFLRPHPPTLSTVIPRYSLRPPAPCFSSDYFADSIPTP